MNKIPSGVLFCAAVFCGAQTNAFAGDYDERPEVRTYINMLEAKHGFKRERLEALFGGAERQDAVIKAMDRQAEAKPWYEYKRIFINDPRVEKGLDFWKENAELLARVEREYRVPMSVMLAIVGVETYYGDILGRHPVFDTLVTLGFDYPRRAKFFRNELTEMLLLGREEGFDYDGLKGSFSGAVGVSQFMPSSYRQYAVDFDDNGRRDLWRPPDALGSIANYLTRHGWKPGGAIASRIDLEGDTSGLPFNKELKPWLPRSDLSNYGIKNISGLAETEPLFSLFSFEVQEGVHEHWAAYHNFYVISRYNHSRRYAMAVYQLSEILKRRYSAATGGD